MRVPDIVYVRAKIQEEKKIGEKYPEKVSQNAKKLVLPSS